MRKINKRTAVVSGMTGLIAATLGIATAATLGNWTATDSGGNGYGKAYTMVVSGSTAATDAATNSTLYPGVTANGTSTGGNLYVKVTNNNPFSLSVTSIAVPANASVDATCAVSSVAQTFTPAANTILGSGGSQVFTVTNELSMGTSAANSCQGSTFNVGSVTVNATQVTG